MLVDLRAPSIVDRLAVTGLSLAEVEEFVQQTLGAEAGDVAETLYAETEGNLYTHHGDSAGARRVTDAAFQLAQELGEPDGPAWWAATLCPLDWHAAPSPSGRTC